MTERKIRWVVQQKLRERGADEIAHKTLMVKKVSVRGSHNIIILHFMRSHPRLFIFKTTGNASRKGRCLRAEKYETRLNSKNESKNHFDYSFFKPPRGNSAGKSTCQGSLGCTGTEKEPNWKPLRGIGTRTGIWRQNR